MKKLAVLLLLLPSVAAAQLEITSAEIGGITTWDSGHVQAGWLPMPQVAPVRLHQLQTDRAGDPAWSVAQGGRIRVAEETTGDAETAVNVSERISGADFFSLDSSVGVVGIETGQARVGGDVLVASLGHSPAPAVLRVEPSGPGAWDLSARDWSGGAIAAEIAYGVFAAGTRVLDGALQVHAASVPSVTHQWLTVSLPPFNGPPVVLATLNSRNGPDAALVRVRSVSASSVEIRVEEGEGLNGIHVPETVGLVAIGLKPADLQLWAGGCVHWATGAHPGSRFPNQIADAERVGGFDAFLLLGDIGEGCDPSAEHTALVQEQLAHVTQPVLTLAGNHDGHPSGLDWYLEATGAPGPFVHEATFGNVRLLMMSDDNTGPDAFGRTCGAGSGGPSGRWNAGQVAWWLDRIGGPGIVITASHQSPPATTIGTGYFDGLRYKVHGSLTWADKTSGGLLAFGDVTADGRDTAGNFIDTGNPLADALVSSTAHRLWIAAHSHGRIVDGASHRGLGFRAKVGETAIFNTGGMSPVHAAPIVPSSSLISFWDGADFAVVRSVFHGSFGGYEDLARSATRIELGQAFQK